MSGADEQRVWWRAAAVQLSWVAFSMNNKSATHHSDRRGVNRLAIEGISGIIGVVEGMHHAQWIRSIAIGLRPGGRGLVSATFNIRKRPTNYCTIKHIFAGGYIPSLSETLLLMEKHGLDVRAVETALTTITRPSSGGEAIWRPGGIAYARYPARFNEKFRRCWLYYLAGALETFEATREIINCYHITFVKGRFAHDDAPNIGLA